MVGAVSAGGWGYCRQFRYLLGPRSWLLQTFELQSLHKEIILFLSNGNGKLASPPSGVEIFPPTMFVRVIYGVTWQA